MPRSNTLKSPGQYYVRLILALAVLIGATIIASGPTAFTASATVNVPPPPIWSAPVNLGPVINSSASDQGPAISPDGLSLYVTSNRIAGSLGGFDMYVSQRASVNEPWGSPVNLGPAVNTDSDEGNAAFDDSGDEIHHVFALL